MYRSTLATALLGGCAHGAAVDTLDMDSFHADGVTVAGSLSRLASIEILSGATLVDEDPDASFHCYGACEDDWALMRAQARQAERLDALMDAADRATRAARPATRAEALAAMARIQALGIVDLAPYDPGCDDADACPGEPERAGALVALAALAKPL